MINLLCREGSQYDENFMGTDVMGFAKAKIELIGDYVEFAKYYLEFIETELQAELVAKNENNYRFFQYRRDGEYNITRPVNSELFFKLAE